MVYGIHHEPEVSFSNAWGTLYNGLVQGVWLRTDFYAMKNDKE